MSISVVIPTHNAARTIASQLDALASQTFDGDWEVIVVDDGSTDQTLDSVDLFRDQLPLRTVSTGRNRGINHARNTGIDLGQGDRIAICDADDVCAPGWLAALNHGLGRFDIVGGELDESLLNSPAVISWRPARPRGRLPVALGHLPYAVGANMGMRREVWVRLGGFDESTRRGGAEIDFSWRALEAGYELGYLPDAIIHYRLRDSLSTTAIQSFWYSRGDVRLSRSRSIVRPIRHPLWRLFGSPLQESVPWWQWVPGRASYACGYAVGTVTEHLAGALSGLRG